MVARQQVVNNSYLWPDGTVEYQQWGTASPTGDRPDCSGYVAGCCWGIPVEVNTVSLVTDGWMYEIPADQLQPGDALGMCGPGTAGDDGHIQLFIRFDNTGLFIAEQTGGGPGPHHHTVKRITPGYKAYRFKGIADGAPPAQEDDDMLMHRVRSGVAGDGSIYLVPGYSAPDGKMAAFGLDGPRNEAYASVPMIQLPAGMSVPGSGYYNTSTPAAWPVTTGGGASGPTAEEIATAVVDEEHNRLAN
jgi:hypothetical protein